MINLEIDGIKVWQSIRWRLFRIITSKYFNLGIAHASKKGKIKRIIPMIYYGIRYTAFFERQHDIIVFPHHRVRLVMGQYIDIYTKHLVKELFSANKDVLVLERPYGQKHHAKINNYTKYTDDSIIFINLFKKFIKTNIKSNDSLINKLNSEIKERFNVKLNLAVLFKDAIQHYKLSYKFYSFLFKKIKPKQIYIVVSYAYPSMVKAAKNLNVEVVELQHGAFSKYHLGYGYDTKDSVDYFPDKFLVWNKFWRDICILPINKNNIEVYPFKFQDTEVAKYKKLLKNKNQVVVLSQGPIADHMSKIILDNFDFFKDKDIKYKLHPGEVDNYQGSHFLTTLLNKENVELVTNDNLYELFATSEYQVGVYSTAIYEGLEFGLKTILCNTLFVEYMEELIKLDKIYLILHEKK